MGIGENMSKTNAVVRGIVMAMHRTLPSLALASYCASSRLLLALRTLLVLAQRSACVSGDRASDCVAMVRRGTVCSRLKHPVYTGQLSKQQTAQ